MPIFASLSISIFFAQNRIGFFSILCRKKENVYPKKIESFSRQGRWLNYPFNIRPEYAGTVTVELVEAPVTALIKPEPTFT